MGTLQAERSIILKQLLCCLGQLRFPLKEVIKQQEIIGKIEDKLHSAAIKFKEYHKVHTTSPPNPKPRHFYNRAEKIYKLMRDFADKVSEKRIILYKYMDSLREFGDIQIANLGLAEEAKTLTELSNIQIPGFCFVVNVSFESFLAEWDNLMVEAKIADLMADLKVFIDQK